MLTPECGFFFFKKEACSLFGNKDVELGCAKKIDLNWVCGPHHINGGHNFVL